MKTITLAISAAALVAAGAAYADHHMDRKGADADNNGLITLAEHDAHAAQKFARMDANGDGVVTAEDREARREARRTQMFDKLDANSDGNITRAEFMAFEHEGKRGGKHRMGKRGGSMMKMADANGDGQITQAEFNAAARTRFEKMDANGDGQVSKEERQAAHAEMRGKWREKRGASES